MKRSELVKNILENLDAIQEMNSDLNEQLMTALYNLDFIRAIQLVKSGADLNLPYNRHGWTPFMWIAKELYEVNIVNEFIYLGGNVNQENEDGETPLLIAARKRSSPEIINLLLENGADINHQDRNGYTAIMKVIAHPQFEMRQSVFKALKNAGADMKTLRNNQGKTAEDMWEDVICPF